MGAVCFCCVFAVNATIEYSSTFIHCTVAVNLESAVVGGIINDYNCYDFCILVVFVKIDLLGLFEFTV